MWARLVSQLQKFQVSKLGSKMVEIVLNSY